MGDNSLRTEKGTYFMVVHKKLCPIKNYHDGGIKSTIAKVGEKHSSKTDLIALL